MEQIRIRNSSFLLWYLLLVAIITGWYGFTQLRAMQTLTADAEIIKPVQNGPTFIVAIISILLAILLLLFTRLRKKPATNTNSTKMAPIVSYGVAILIVLGSVIFLSLSTHQAMWGASGRILIFVWAAGLGSWLLYQSRKEIPQEYGFLGLLLVAGVLYRITLFIPDIQLTPFSLGWSEGSRYNNAALFLSNSLFGVSYPLPVLHPARYLMQAIPFLFAPDMILIHRIWQVMLWLGMTFLGAHSLAKRLSIKNRFTSFLVVLWLFLFFFQGAVYYHLMVVVVLILLGYQRNSFWRTLVFVLLASVWAGLCRVNWYPVPALLATALYVMEEPLTNKRWLAYLRNPILWTIAGGLTAFLTNRIYAANSGNEVSQFSSSFSSYMIWSRLFPNTTFPLGIIPAILLVSLPLVLLTWMKIRKRGIAYYWQWLRSLGLLAILAIFGLGGVIVSVKIGGGGDLHNLDAFLVFLVVIALYFLFDRYVPQKTSTEMPVSFPFYSLVLIVIIPLFFVVKGRANWEYKNLQLASQEVGYLQNAIALIQKTTPGPILFISETQLYTFGELNGFEIQPEYEKVFMMEMVMSHYEPYLNTLQQKFREREFAAILTDSLFVSSADQKEPFWVENNLWVDQIVIPMLEDYELVLPLQEGAANLLIPRNQESLFNKLIKKNQ